MEAFRILTILSLFTNVFYCVLGDECSDAAKAYNQCTEKYGINNSFTNSLDKLHIKLSLLNNPNFDHKLQRAYDYYKNALKSGEDGRPDFKARKSCNYMTEAVEVLTKILNKHSEGSCELLRSILK